jgi:hypothetical protein
MKPGYKTTEFWVAILTPIVLPLLKLAFPDYPEESFLTVVAYILARFGIKWKNGATA